MNNLNVYFDGYGYINNRGKSKYWGVAVHQNDNNKWRVAFTADGTKYDFYFQDNANPKELVVAQIAADLYSYRTSPTKIPCKLTVNTICGQFEVVYPNSGVGPSRTGYIRQINFVGSPAQKEIDPNLPDSFNSTGTFTDLEEQILRGLYKGVATDELTAVGIKAINTMLATVESKQ